MSGKGKLRPHLWICGPDKFKHDMYMPWMRAKAQANFRDEGWLLTFEQYYEIWRDYWHVRGTGGEDYCMTRYDSEKPWQVDNVYLTTRREHMAKKNIKYRGVKRGPYRPRKKGYDDSYELIRVQKKRT
jgi:hypothetical protein